jgi:hypothetical protein
MKGCGLMEEFLPLCSTTHTSHLGTEKTPRGFFFKPQTRRNPNTNTNLPPTKRQQVSPQYLKKIATICRERLGRGAFLKRNAPLLLLLPLLLGV